MLQQPPSRCSSLADVADGTQIARIGERVDRHPRSSHSGIIVKLRAEPLTDEAHQLRRRRRGPRGERRFRRVVS